MGVGAGARQVDGGTGVELGVKLSQRVPEPSGSGRSRRSTSTCARRGENIDNINLLDIINYEHQRHLRSVVANINGQDQQECNNHDSYIYYFPSRLIIVLFDPPMTGACFWLHCTR